MKTYLIVYFGTTGTKASEIAKNLEKIGFETVYGPYDFIYRWDAQKPTPEEILALGDKIVDALKGSGAVFNLDTHD
ncbi:hypothetical protein J4211_00595 [Candidatus Woesearchaeota archaeon]|nr:hypothetical protein [Candidatus Woesearchaeota archaeon]